MRTPKFSPINLTSPSNQFLKDRSLSFVIPDSIYTKVSSTYHHYPFLYLYFIFNLFSRHFFADLTKRYGIIYSSGLDGCSRKYVAFGRTKPREYFVFDCDTRDAPMFNKNLGKPFILRMTTLNRLVHVLTLTLRGGNFYIFDVTIKDLQPVE